MQMIVASRMPLLSLLLLGIVVACGKSEHGQTRELPTGKLPATQPQRTAQDDKQSYPSSSPTEITVDGRYLKAFSVALERHQAIPDLTERQKQMESYVVQFSEDEYHIDVLLIPRIAKGTFPVGGDTPHGRTARYSVAKASYRVVAETFFE
ncbi:MAG TPA: hypothetical protein VGF48_24930 [Thermoanaerobaculia bacterium]|jgi:hypothetical protein